MPIFDPELVGICGVYCEYCPAYDTKCPGCLKDPHSKECALYRCASEKGVKCCFRCGDFPCQTHYEKGIYTKQTLDNWKHIAK